MADALISIRGINPDSNTPPGGDGPGRAVARSVTLASDDNTTEGDYLLVISSVDYQASLRISNTSGVDSWVQLAALNDGYRMQSAAWLGQVTTGGPRTVNVQASDDSSALYLQVWTLDAAGGPITQDGNVTTATDERSPYQHSSITVAGGRSLLVCYHAGVQFSGTLNYGDAPPGMSLGCELYEVQASGQQSCYQFLDNPGATGPRSQTSNISDLAGATGAMFALHAELTSTPTTAGTVTVTGPPPTIDLIDPDVHAHPGAGPVGVTGPPPRLTETAHPGASPVTVDGPTPGVAHVAHTGPGVTAVSGPAAFAGGTLAEPGPISVTGPPPRLGFSGQDAPAHARLVEMAAVPPTRVIAQTIQTGEFLHWELPVADLSVEWVLSGPTAISGKFPTELADLRDLRLEPWGTWIHVEEDGIIRASGILQPAQIDQNETLTLEALGVSAYAKGIPFEGNFTLSGTDPASGESGIGVGLDPADIVRAIWAEVQAHPDGDLGVTVLGGTGVTIGTPARDVDFTTGSGENVSFVAGPYSKLDWWEHTDCGGEIDRLAGDTPFDYVERCAWNADKTGVEHWVQIGWPRTGRTLDTVRLAQDENLLAAVGPEEPDGRYASAVIVLGSGEGSARVRGYAGRSVGTRLRRVKVVDDKTIQSTTAANARARSELELCQALQDVTEATVAARHVNAPLGSYQVGDAITLWADVPWIGEVTLLQRILSYVYSPDADSVKLTLRSASSFSFGGSGG